LKKRIVVVFVDVNKKGRSAIAFVPLIISIRALD
jgi:hypothetical protein